MLVAAVSVCLGLVAQPVLTLGDRFAWSPVDLAADAREGKEVEQVVRNVRKVEDKSEEQIEGRFVGKEVLCNLGLADCTPKLSDAIQYVQPVRVVPYGEPVPAVQAEGQYSVPVDTDRQFTTSYGAPQPSYGAPKPSYGAPKPSYGAPTLDYGAPSPSKPTYEAPKPSYKAPAPVYAPPPAKYSPPTDGYGAPAAPAVSKVSSTRDQRETDFQTSFSTHVDTLPENARPTREGRRDECFCVPVGQCPAANVVGATKDYSALINPRVKTSDIGITAPAGRSGDILEVVSVSASAPKVEGEEESGEEEQEGVSRRRRNRLSTDNEQPSDKLTNSYVPEKLEEETEDTEEYEHEEDGLALLRNLSDEERLQRRAQRKAERQAKRKAATAKAVAEALEAAKDEAIAAENADLAEERLFGGLANLITGSTSTGQLQPTVGVSFGLPQAGPGYGGYQQNPVGTGGAVNPYYTGAQGIEVGAVNLNPLFSFQAGTKEDGSVALKPLVNLHLTPNGCGVLGCDKSTYDYVDFTLKSIPNPIDAVKNLFAGEPDYGVYGDYTAPKPSYLPPSSGYGPPSTGYGVPNSGYGPPSSGYGAPSTDYNAPNYQQPSSSYVSPSYQPPAASYQPSQHSYVPPHPGHTETSQTVGPVNIHHHFHHQDAGVVPRDSPFAENNQVKRNTENGGFIPMDGLSKPQESGGAFRFPRRTSSRGGRKLDLPEVAEEEVQLSGFRFSKEKGGRRLDVDMDEEHIKDIEEEVDLKLSEEKGGRRLDIEVEEEEEGEDTSVRRLDHDVMEADIAIDSDESVEVVYSEETVPQGGKVKFVERRKRSPDGIGHHGHHGHHQAGNGAAFAAALPQAFGPNGVRPPTCGGPGSGYVCCSSRGSSTGSFSSPALDFNELAPSSSIRDVRQQPQQFNGVVGSGFPGGNQFSTFGQCGRKNTQGITGRINNPANSFNEGDTEFGEYPWQAAILKKEEYDNVYVCGGSLIDSSHIITAAHCIKQYRPEELRIRLGEWDVNNDSEFYPNIELDVLSISIHPEFYSGNLYNDIAIIKLDGFLDFQRNPHISPVCLPDSLADFSGDRCFVTGWGKDAFGGDGSYQHTLKEVDVPMLGHADCERKLRQTRLGYDFTLHPGFICAGGEEGKDACKGDGGGPLVCQRGGSWQLAGLVSWGVGCGQRDVPGVYVKVSQYNQWIQEMMLTT